MALTLQRVEAPDDVGGGDRRTVVEAGFGPQRERHGAAIGRQRHRARDQPVRAVGLVVGRLQKRVEQFEQAGGGRAGEDQRIERIERARRGEADLAALRRVGVDVVEMIEIRLIFRRAIGRVGIDIGFEGGGGSGPQRQRQAHRV